MTEKESTAMERTAPPVPALVDEAIRETLATFAAPGTWLTGWQRAAIVAHVRDGVNGVPATSEDADPLLAATHRIAVAPSSVTGQWVDRLEIAGLDRLTYVEVVGVVARAMAVDAFAWAVDRPPPDVPPTTNGTPSRAIVPDARRTGAWVPIAGPPNAVTALSAVAAERTARSRLSAALYLRDDDVPVVSSDPGRGPLSRPQMELVATRVSYANDCFY